MLELLDKWKAVLTAIGAALVVVLQIINVLLSNGIETTVTENREALDQKAAVLQANAAKLNTLVEQNRADLVALHDELHEVNGKLGKKP